MAKVKIALDSDKNSFKTQLKLQPFPFVVYENYIKLLKYLCY